MDASKYSLEELLVIFDKENKTVIDLVRRLSGIKTEIAHIRHKLSYAEKSASRF